MADTVNIYKADNSRYEKMTYNPVGKSGLKFPAISLGLWHNFGSKDNYDNMKQMLRTAFDSGITQFDLANNYGPVIGSAEESLGRLMKDDFSPYLRILHMPFSQTLQSAPLSSHIRSGYNCSQKYHWMPPPHVHPANAGKDRSFLFPPDSEENAQ